uniref:Uncharacterized protein n=1 Tax=viral metagenome TaxID=1070528 RepID=A0A6M3L2L9_9ZZZZ
MSKFITELEAKLIKDDRIWKLDSPLEYESDLLGLIEVPGGFETDLASVPRVPFVYMFWGGKAHREGVIHDYLFRIDSVPLASYSQANEVFFEAMKVRGKPVYVRYPMWWGVVLGGWTAYHKKYVGDKL